MGRMFDDNANLDTSQVEDRSEGAASEGGLALRLGVADWDLVVFLVMSLLGVNPAQIPGGESDD